MNRFTCLNVSNFLSKGLQKNFVLIHFQCLVGCTCTSLAVGSLKHSHHLYSNLAASPNFCCFENFCERALTDLSSNLFCNKNNQGVEM